MKHLVFLLCVVLASILTQKNYAQESKSRQMQVSATVVPSCIIQTDEFNPKPYLYCTKGFAMPEPSSIIQTEANMSTETNNDLAVIITHIDF